jgi:hypothetical protein
MIDNVRLLVGDTDASNQMLTDVNIDFFLDEANGNTYLAASMAADAIAAKCARDVTNSQSDSQGLHTLSRNSSDKYKHYKELAATLMKRYQQGAGSSSNGSTAAALNVFAGGISKADKSARNADSDRTGTAFSRTLHDHPSKTLTSVHDE